MEFIATDLKKEVPVYNNNCNNFAIVVSNAQYGYGAGKTFDLILNGVNVNIPKGSIYALLGPSGCGKTTLLKALCKTISLQKGAISFLYQEYPTRPIPGSGIGYMPQETALVEELSVRENLQLFASLNGCKEYLKKARTLMDMLDMDLNHFSTQLAANLSGGEKRRLSFVLALMHEPPVVVLDEPTVGVDPLIREKIWRYLAHLAKYQGRTIIITTHYINEAKGADYISFMRKGRVIAETTKKELTDHFRDLNLETCYQKLFEMDQKNTKYPSSFTYKHEENNKVHEISKSRDFLNLMALTRRNLQLVKRNLPLIAFSLILPAFQTILFSTIVGTKLTHLPFSVVNMETPKMLSPNYLKRIDSKTFDVKSYSELDQALGSVKDGTSWGTIEISGNFTKCLFRRLKDGLNVSNETLDCSSIKVHLDYTNHQIMVTVWGEIISAYETFSREMLQLLGRNPAIADSPLRMVKPPIYGRFDTIMAEYFMPNMAVNILFSMCLTLTSVTLVMERNSGIMDRFLTTGATRTQILLSHFFGQFVFIPFQILIMITFPYLIFGFPNHGSILLSVVSLIILSWSAMACGLWISSITDSVRVVISMQSLFLYPALFMSGFFWPMEGMPRVLRYIGYCFPMTLEMRALRANVMKGFGLDKSNVYLGLVSSSVWFTIFMILSIIVFKYKK